MEDSPLDGDSETTDPDFIAWQEALIEPWNEFGRHLSLASEVGDIIAEAEIRLLHGDRPDEMRQLLEERQRLKDAVDDFLYKDPGVQRINREYNDKFRALQPERELKARYHFRRYKQAKQHAELTGVSFGEAAQQLFGEETKEELEINKILSERKDKGDNQ